MWNRQFLVVILCLAGLLWLSSCSSEPESSPSSSPSATQSSPTPSPTPTESVQPTPSQTPGISFSITPYPNASILNTSNNHGTDADGNSITVHTIWLETTDSYEQVKAYYESNQPAGFQTTMAGDDTGADNNRTYSAYLLKPEDKAMIILNISEYKDAGKVAIHQIENTPD